ncbi:recombination and repair protein RecT [Streptomyces gancidicus BKS 13-15]|uniref:Recombination and repair protein RecT n=1 Tax=Streptomyces gancidicus BKS 13-15 TaxID=1284664 RepID=M3EBK2_STREZ|nr:recombinase RecT [Streptomyces gancidicus]EMF31087.1 recombination and repair protein RecT [Streptomyces gancidicus BKS 13-15]
MALSTLKDRVKAAAAGAVAAGDDTEHERADGTEEAPAGHPEFAVREWLDRYQDDIEAALPKHISAGLFLAALRPVLPTLAKCTPASILQAVITCARFGLIPDGRQAAITADDGIATFVATYHGYIELMYRSGLVRSVVVEMVYEGDEWTYEPTAPAPLDFTHKPDVLAAKKDRKPLFAYAFAWLEGGVRSAVSIVTLADAEEIRDEYSKAYQRAEANGKKNSFWHTHFTDMWLKTAIRKLFKLVPASAELRALAAVEQAAEDGRPQILAAVDPETAALEADARRAAAAAEASQDAPTTRTLPRKVSAGRGRAKPRRRNRDKRRR